MTIHDDYDELASAYLDGEATADEIARVESDPELLAIVEEFRTIAQAVAAPISLPDETTRETAIAAAISATGAIPTAPAVRSLDAARTNRRERMNKLMSIAAGFLVVVAGGAIIWAIANNSNRTTDTATATSADSADSVSDAASDESADFEVEAEAMAEEEAMEEDAIEEEAMEEEAVEAAGDTVQGQALDDSARANVGAEADEERLGDDDAADEEAASEDTASEGAAPVEAASDDRESTGESETSTVQAATLAELLGQSRNGFPDTESGLFPVPIAERNDYRGSFATTADLTVAAAGIDVTIGDSSPLDAADCSELVDRLQLAPALLFVGTAHVVDQVTGTEVPLALAQIGDDASLLAISLDDCRVYIGQDDIP